MWEVKPEGVEILLPRLLLFSLYGLNFVLGLTIKHSIFVYIKQKRELSKKQKFKILNFKILT